MTDNDQPRPPKPSREERLQEQLRANLKRRKEQARARRETHPDGARADETMPSPDGNPAD